MIDKDLINSFCSSRDTKYLNRLTEKAKKTLIEYSYNVLFQKNGNMDIAKLALKHFNEIDIIASDLPYVYEICNPLLVFNPNEIGKIFNIIRYSLEINNRLKQ